jgi:hypothetical protein
MGLQHKLAAEFAFIVHHSVRTPRSPSSARGREPSRAAADDQHVCGNLFHIVQFWCGGSSGKAGRPSTLCTIMLARTLVMQLFTGTPLAITAHLAHWPLAQNIPWALRLCGGDQTHECRPP